MAKLTSGDLSRVLEAVAKLNSGVDLTTLPSRSLSCINSLIPNEMAVFDGFDAEGEYTGFHWYSPDLELPDRFLERLSELIHEHPVYETVLVRGLETTFRTTDYLSISEFHKTRLFNEVYKLVSGDTQLGTAMRVSQRGFVTHSLYRKKLDFSDVDHSVMKLITPHLKAAFSNALHFNELDRERRYLNKAGVKGVIVLGSEGKVMFQSNLAERLMRNYFTEFGSSGLPVPVQKLVELQTLRLSNCDYFLPVEPLIVSKGPDRIKVTITFDTRDREVLVFIEESHEYEISDFEKSGGVTRREAEILYWISQGKTDPQIAEILSVSPRTVHKHLEHIFAKLGVETRTAAVLQSIDFF
jgi:DNA-binding CsgD family transcriptional regulator